MNKRKLKSYCFPIILRKSELNYNKKLQKDILCWLDDNKKASEWELYSKNGLRKPVEQLSYRWDTETQKKLNQQPNSPDWIHGTHFASAVSITTPSLV